MAKCSACGRFISATDGVACSTCPFTYHQGCLGKGKASKTTKPWSCPECTKNKQRDNGQETPAKGDQEMWRSPDNNIGMSACIDSSEQAKFDLAREVNLFRQELQALRGEVKLMRDEMKELRSTLTSNNERMDNLEERVQALEKGAQNKGSTAVDFNAIITQLRLELNEKDQELLSNDIEISNLPEMPGENPTHLVALIGTKLGVSIEERDIVSAERVGPRNLRGGGGGGGAATEGGAGGARSGKPRPLVVRLARRSHRDDILRSMRVRRGANTSDFGIASEARSFYINERLTKANRQLLFKVREARLRMRWKFVWVRRGRIFVRQGEGGPVYNIRSDDDITRVFGTAVVDAA